MQVNKMMLGSVKGLDSHHFILVLLEKVTTGPHHERYFVIRDPKVLVWNTRVGPGSDNHLCCLEVPQRWLINFDGGIGHHLLGGE